MDLAVSHGHVTVFHQFLDSVGGGLIKLVEEAMTALKNAAHSDPDEKKLLLDFWEYSIKEIIPAGDKTRLLQILRECRN